MFDIDWNKVVAWLWPPLLRNSWWVNFCRALISPIVTNYNTFIVFRNNNIYTLNHTSQVFSIESALNDRFDPVDRRIYLMDTDNYDAIYLQPDDDQLPVYLDTDSYSDLLLHPDSSYSSSGFDFVVILPYAFTSSDIYQLKALVNYYKLAGVRYDIVVIENP